MHALFQQECQAHKAWHVLHLSTETQTPQSDNACHNGPVRGVLMTADAIRQ